MILLPVPNSIIQDTLTTHYAAENKTDQTLLIPTPIQLQITGEKVKISASITGYEQIKPEETLKKIFGDKVQEKAEDGWNVTVCVEGNANEQLITDLASIKRHILSAPFERAFDKCGQNGEVEVIKYRDLEAFYIQPMTDRVTVIVSVVFKDETDQVLAKTFLQEFVDVRKQPNTQNAPQVLYTTKHIPRELQGLGLKEIDNMSYVTFVLFPRHFSTSQLRSETISRLQSFRDYLHYHVKCSKAYLHSRMRSKTADWTKVLNRAKPEVVNAEKKLASGKTFVRKV